MPFNLIFSVAADTTHEQMVWIGIVAFLGFIFGSITPNDPYRGTKFDLPGALTWAVAAGLLTSGYILWTNNNEYQWEALSISGLGAIIALLHISTSLPDKASDSDLQSGIYRAEGKDLKRKLKAARYLFETAGFKSKPESSYCASRSKRKFEFDHQGPSSETLYILAEGIREARHDTFDIFVMLVRSLPGETEQPAIIVVRSIAELQKIKIETDGIIVPCCTQKIPLNTIAAMSAYAWRL